MIGAFLSEKRREKSEEKRKIFAFYAKINHHFIRTAAVRKNAADFYIFLTIDKIRPLC